MNNEDRRSIKIQVIKSLRTKARISVKEIGKLVDEVLDRSNELDANKALDEVLKLLATKGKRFDDREATVRSVCCYHGTQGVGVVSMSYETDFAAKSESAINFLCKISKLVYEKNLKSKDAFLSSSLEHDGRTISGEEYFGLLLAELREGLALDSINMISHSGPIGLYVHGQDTDVKSKITDKNITMGKEAGIVCMEGGDQNLAKSIALHIVGSEVKPVALKPDLISENVRQKEYEIAFERSRAEGKPEDKLEFIAKKRLQSRLEELALMTQEFCGNTENEGSTTVQDHLKGTAKINSFYVL